MGRLERWCWWCCCSYRLVVGDLERSRLGWMRGLAWCARRKFETRGFDLGHGLGQLETATLNKRGRLETYTSLIYVYCVIWRLGFDLFTS